MAVPSMYLGGIPLWVNPVDARWNFRMRVKDYKTLQGKVIQILGTEMGDITITGRYSPDRRKGEREAWEAQLRFREQVDAWAEEASQSDNKQGIRFTYPRRNWDFLVFVKMFSFTEFTPQDVAPPWSLTLYPVDARAWRVVRGVKDLYIKRLMDGIGWKQTEYNGPTFEEVESELGGRSVEEYLAEEQVQEPPWVSGDGATPGVQP